VYPIRWSNGMQREHIADSVEGCFGLALLNKSDDGIDDNGGEQHSCIYPVAEQSGLGYDRHHVDQDVGNYKRTRSQTGCLAGGGSRLGL